jgi:tRNA-specific 2-thiouridylase
VPGLQFRPKVRLARPAAAWDAAAVATGHYARVERDAETGRWRSPARARPAQGPDRFPLAADAGPARAARFPIGDLTKDEVREYARRLGLVTADKPESQEICFVADGNYRGFLRQREPATFRAGSIVDVDGRLLGRHEGVAGFTIGQRRGLGLAAGRALYVVDLDPAADRVTVGAAADLERDRLVAGRVNFIAGTPPAGPQRILAKIRHNHEPAAATLRMLPEGQAEVVFDQPQRAIAPGQSCVWYQGEVVLGGGVIERR